MMLIISTGLNITYKAFLFKLITNNMFQFSIYFALNEQPHCSPRWRWGTVTLPDKTQIFTLFEFVNAACDNIKNLLDVKNLIDECESSTAEYGHGNAIKIELVIINVSVWLNNVGCNIITVLTVSCS